MDTQESVLYGALGDIGPWQVKIFLLVSFLKFPTAWTLLAIIFIGAPVPFTCTGSEEECTDINGNVCTNWTYNRTVFRETITTEWNLVCSRKHLTNLAQTTFMIGVLLGTILFSMGSDRWGRKNLLIFTGIIQLIAGVLSSFVPWYWGFIGLRFIQALVVGGNMTIGFVLCMEILNGKWRTIMASLTHIPFNLGSIAMAAVAHYTREWRLFQLILSLPVGIIVFYGWLIPESPRWLLAVGKDKEAWSILQKAAKSNGRTLPEKIPVLKRPAVKDGETAKKAGFLDLFRTPNLRRRTLIIWFCWLNTGLCFFGLQQYVSHVGNDIFINVAVSSASILPGVFFSMYTMDRFGRRLTLFGGFFISGVSCILICFIPSDLDDVESYRVTLATLGVSATAVGFSTLYLFSTELFPTVVRNTGLGSGSMCARIGSMVAPFIASLGHTSPKIPAVMFGGISLFASALCLLLPETANCELAVTIEEGEQFGSKYKSPGVNCGTVKKDVGDESKKNYCVNDNDACSKL